MTPLNANDRCDRCGAQAYVLINILVIDKAKDCGLLLCSHHFHEHESQLIYNGATVEVDQRELLRQKEGASA